MRWRIPVIWQMTGTQEVEADRLEDAMERATDSFDATDGEFKDGSLELDCYEVEAVRAIYNNNCPDYLDKQYPELSEYRWEDKIGFLRSIPYCSENSPTIYLKDYEIIFDVAGNRYYFYCVEKDIGNALALFFRENPHITYDMIVDHVEV